MTPPVCSECGARVPEGAAQCELCGTSFASTDDAASPAADVGGALRLDTEASRAPVTPRPGIRPGRFCIACGAENPPGARFCNQCGSPMAHEASVDESVTLTSPTPVSAAKPAAVLEAGVPAKADSVALGKRAGLLIGGAAAAVAVLYALTLWSGSATPAPGETASAPTAQAAASVPVALSPQIAGRVAELESAIEAEEDPTLRLARQKELVETLATAGAFVRAAEVQEAIAEAAPSSDAWAEAGGLFLTEVLRSPDTNQAPTAARAAAAYERALEIDPANLDVKTDLATAYQYDAQNPMRSVQTLREVLDTDPDHVQANFNFGLMLAVIGRMDQAEERFQRVLDLTEHDDPIHVRADTELANLRAVAAEQP